MTHFVINEDFDHALIQAIQNRDAAFLKAINPNLMKDGTSELLNWVSASGCLFQTRLSGDLIDYVPCYRSEAGAGTAQGFLVWRYKIGVWPRFSRQAHLGNDFLIDGVGAHSIEKR
jgi:OH-DDVA oxygenase/3-O-methylgallate 3,4-dioxygenase